MRIEVNGGAAATILRKCNERTIVQSYDPFLITGDDRPMKNPGRFEGDLCFGGYEGDGDSTGERA